MTTTLIGRLLAPLFTGRIGLHERLRRAEALHRQRATLAQLDAERLRDLGLTETEAHAEACRPVWDAPAHWYDANPRRRRRDC